MIKTLIVVSLAVFSCHSQLNIQRKAVIGSAINRFQPWANQAWGAPAIAVQQAQGVVAAAPVAAAVEVAAPAAVEVAAPVAVAARAPLPIPIHKFQTQEVLPLQQLNPGPLGPQVVEVKSQQEPVLVHFQSQSVPVQVETSHVPSPPSEVTITQSRDEPHHVIHEVIRPVIQEVREVIQPYRRVTQEVRPVQEEVNTGIAADAGQGRAAVAGVAVAAPAPAVVSQPIAVSAPTQSVWTGAQPGYGVIQAPAPLLTGSYIQQFIEGLRLRTADTPLVVSRPAITLEAPAPKAVAVEAAEPVAAEAVVEAPAAPVVARGGGGVSFTRKYVEYP